jgi:hypothetical protein
VDGYQSFLAPRSVDRIVGELDGRAVAIVAATTDGGVVLQVTPQGQVRVAQTGLGLDILLDALDAVIKTTARAQALLAGLRLNQLVRDHLLPHLEGWAAGADGPLVVVPVGVVNWLPLQAVACADGLRLELWTDLVDSPEVRPAATGTPLVVHSDGPSDRTLPDLAAGRVEAETIADRLGVSALVDPEVDPDAVAQRLTATGFVHLVCHGSADLTDPDNTGLYLGEATLTVGRLAELLASEGAPTFVGLGACQSARTETVAPEQASSLASVFLGAGSRAVLATLWNVDDDLAHDFVIGFLQRWSTGMLSGDAYASTFDDLLVSAQREGNTGSLDSLFAFTLYGDHALGWPGPPATWPPSTGIRSEPSRVMRGGGVLPVDDLGDDDFGQIVVELAPYSVVPRETLLDLVQRWLDALDDAESNRTGLEAARRARQRLATKLGLENIGLGQDRATGTGHVSDGAEHRERQTISERTRAALRALARDQDDDPGSDAG